MASGHLLLLGGRLERAGIVLDICCGHLIAAVVGGLRPPSAPGNCQQLGIHFLQQVLLHQTCHVEQLWETGEQHAMIGLALPHALYSR